MEMDGLREGFTPLMVMTSFTSLTPRSEAFSLRVSTIIIRVVRALMMIDSEADTCRRLTTAAANSIVHQKPQWSQTRNPQWIKWLQPGQLSKINLTAKYRLQVSRTNTCTQGTVVATSLFTAATTDN